MQIEPNFFESMLIIKGKIKLIERHFIRLENNAKLIGGKLNFNILEFEKAIAASLRLNIDYAKARVKFIIENKQIIISSVELFPILKTEINSETPIKISIFKEKIKEKTDYSNCKIENSVIYKDSIEYANNREFHHSIILNNLNEVVESSIATIYFIQGKQIYTPPLNSGCVSGVMRTFLMEKFPIIEKKILLNEINQYDEIFLSNAVRGIILVNQIEEQSFKTLLSNEIRKKLKAFTAEQLD